MIVHSTSLLKTPKALRSNFFNIQYLWPWRAIEKTSELLREFRLRLQTAGYEARYEVRKSPASVCKRSPYIAMLNNKIENYFNLSEITKNKSLLPATRFFLLNESATYRNAGIHHEDSFMQDLSQDKHLVRRLHKN